MKTGIVDKANNHLQPKVGMIMSANKTSKHAPRAQKLYGKLNSNVVDDNFFVFIQLAQSALTSSKTTHLPR